MISDNLKEQCERLLRTPDYKAIAKKTGLSFGYVKDIKNQLRYNESVEKALKNAIKSSIKKLAKEYL